MSNQEVATRTPILPPDISKEKMERVFRDNFNEIRFGDLERMSVPSGGGIFWKLDTLEGQGSEKEIQGVIVSWNETRSYFEGQDAKHVNCWSPDGKWGIGNPGGRCASCNLALFDADGGGTICKEQRSLYIITNKGVLPLHLILPPTSITPFRKFMIRLSSHQLSYWEVLSSFTLKERTNKKGTGYSEVEISPVRPLEPDECAMIAEYKRSFEPRLMKNTMTEVAEDPGDDTAVDIEFKEPSEQDISDYVKGLDREDPKQPGSPDGIPDGMSEHDQTLAEVKVQEKTGQRPPVDFNKSNDEALSQLSWEGLVPSEQQEPEMYKLFTEALSKRFYIRMGKRGFNHDDAKAWMLKASGFDPATQISAKDLLGEADIIQAINTKYYEKFKELLFIQPRREPSN